VEKDGKKNRLAVFASDRLMKQSWCVVCLVYISSMPHASIHGCDNKQFARSVSSELDLLGSMPRKQVTIFRRWLQIDGYRFQVEKPYEGRVFSVDVYDNYFYGIHSSGLHKHSCNYFSTCRATRRLVACVSCIFDRKLCSLQDL
jgi:hypothetical protein